MFDLARFIELILEQCTAGDVADVVFLVLLIVFFAAIGAAVDGRAPGFVHYAPNFL